MIKWVYRKTKIFYARVSWLRWATAFAILFFFTLSNINIYIAYTSAAQLSGSFTEYFISLYNDEYFICYILFVILLILVADIFNGNSNYEENIYIKFGNRWSWHYAHIIYIVFLSLIIVIGEVIVSIILGATHGLSLDVSFEVMLSITNFLGTVNPTFDLLIAFTLIFLRLVTMCLIIYAINLKSKFPFGIIIIFLITVSDIFFYQMFNISSPLFILPIEHTRILFTQGAFPAPYEQQIRINYLYSFLYWGLWITCLLFGLRKIIAKKEFIFNDNKY